MRTLIVLSLVVIGCSTTETAQKPVHNMSREDLVAMHQKYFKAIGLSDEATAELCTVVAGFYDKISKQGRPLVRTREVKFSGKEDFLDKHAQWFAALGVSEKTRAELRTVQAALYDKMRAGVKDPVMEDLGKMMSTYGGMPPCCSPDSLERAKQ